MSYFFLCCPNFKVCLLTCFAFYSKVPLQPYQLPLRLPSHSKPTSTTPTPVPTSKNSWPFSILSGLPSPPRKLAHPNSVYGRVLQRLHQEVHKLRYPNSTFGCSRICTTASRRITSWRMVVVVVQPTPSQPSTIPPPPPQTTPTHHPTSHRPP